MSDTRFDAVAADLIAIEAILRALTRCHARRSRTAMIDLIESLSSESERIKSSEGDYRAYVSRVLDAWVDDIKNEGWMSPNVLN